MRFGGQSLPIVTLLVGVAVDLRGLEVFWCTAQKGLKDERVCLAVLRHIGVIFLSLLMIKMHLLYAPDTVSS